MKCRTEKLKNELRIAMLGHKRIPSREGGIEVVVETLSERMVQKGFHVTCFNRSGHHVAGSRFDSKKEKCYKGICIRYVPTVDLKGLAAFTSAFFSMVMAAFGHYDVVHIHGQGPAWLCWLPGLLGKKTVVTIHGLDWQRSKWGRVASWVIKKGEKNAVKYADEIIVLSDGARRYFYDCYGRQTALIPNGIDPPVHRRPDIIRRQWQLEKDGYVLFLGRIVPEKGIHYLIEAFKGITGKKLVISGGASDTDAYMAKLKASAGDNVVFTGFVQGEVLDELYSNAYIYCLPSDLEGMPLSLLEAMSYGNCCLVSSIEECAAVVADKGVVFEKGNVSSLREKLDYLLHNEAVVKAYKEVSSDYILSQYNWDQVVKETVVLYRK